MLQCFSFKASSKSLPASPTAINIDLDSSIPRACLEDEDSTELQPSPTANLSRELTHALQTRSYNEIWSRIHLQDLNDQEHCVEIHEINGNCTELSLFEVLRPSRELIEEALSHAKPTSFTRLASSYFDHSESATKLCLTLYHGVHRARELYRPLFKLLDTFPHDLHTISESQCNRAFDTFLKLDGIDNPLPCPDSHNFQEMRLCFSQLMTQLDHRLRKSRSRVRLLHRATTGPLCSGYRPGNFKKKELKHISQLDAAAKGTFVLNNELDTIDRRVARLHMAIEGDKDLITLGLERGRDIHPVQEVVKQLRKTHLSFMDQIQDLEDHICLCFNTVNKARSLLFQEIHIRRTYSI